MYYFEDNVTYWRELVLMLVMAVVILADVFVLDSFHVEPMRSAGHAQVELASHAGGAR
ncbi:hypothetical protein [Desulfovibrio oxyclinae]|uniref:hypothetical protein n=1 Tax=Desulfovibrio oxyclinae TaxID=63560 RepID=UPI0003651345|nr:hypothetical protein [Desulfovibrio oxyclinae]